MSVVLVRGQGLGLVQRKFSWEHALDQSITGHAAPPAQCASSTVEKHCKVGRQQTGKKRVACLSSSSMGSDLGLSSVKPLAVSSASPAWICSAMLVGTSKAAPCSVARRSQAGSADPCSCGASCQL